MSKKFTPKKIEDMYNKDVLDFVETLPLDKRKFALMTAPKKEWKDGRYWGIPVWVSDYGDGVDMRGKNILCELLVIPATWFENSLNVICDYFFDDYEPHFRIKIKNDLPSN